MDTPPLLPRPRPARFERLRHLGPFLVLAVVLALLWALVLNLSADQRERLLDDTRRALGSTARATAEQTAGTLHEADTALRVIDLWLSATPGTADAAGLAALADTLRDRSRGMLDVALATAGGQLHRAPSGEPAPFADLGAQPALRALLRPGAASPLAIGEPTKLRPTGPRVLPLAIRLSRPVGELQLAVALVDLERLARVHRGMAREPGGAVGLMRGDGLVLSRTPEGAGVVGRNGLEGASAERRRLLEQDSGWYLSDGRLVDGEPRLIAFQRLDGLPLLALASQSLAAVLAPYQERRRWVLLISAVFSAVALAITWKLGEARRRARLHAAELQAIAQASPLGLFRTDAQGEIVQANDTYLRLHGLTRDQLRWGWLMLLPAAERDAARGAWQASVAQGESLSTLRPGVRPDGRKVMLALHTAPLRVDGRIVGLSGTVQDVTESRAHQRAQQTLSTLFDTSPDFMSQLDAAGRLIYMNPAARQRLGLSPMAPLTGLRFEHFHPPESARRLREEGLPHAIAHGHWRGRVFALDAARREVAVDETLLVQRDEAGRIETILAVLRELPDAAPASAGPG